MPFVVESISADFSIVGNFQMEYSRTPCKMLFKKPEKSDILSRRSY
jgi:hypothetical protein